MKNIVDIKAHIRSLKEKSVINYQEKILEDGFALSNEILKKFPNLLLDKKLSNSKKVNKKKISYPLCLSSWNREETIAVTNQLHSGKLTMGENVKLFEEQFSRYIDSKYAVMVNSGSSANLLILAALILSPKYNFKPEDEVIAPALGWSTSYSPFAQYGIKIRFVDINLSTLNIDANKIEEAITPKTKAILGINILGNPIEFNKINKICKKYNLLLIEDNCESLGATFESKYTGTLGVASSHSFYFSHHLQTIEGGMITTDDKEIYEYAKSLRAHGWTRDLNDGSSIKKINNDNFDDSYRFVLPGYNLRPNELNGVIGLCQLKKIDSFLNIRRKNAEIFKNLFENEPFCRIQKTHQNSSWFGFSLLLEGNLKNKRSHVIYELNKFGIETRPIVTGNFLKNPVIKFYDYSIFKNLKNTETVDNSGFFVGNYNKILTPELQELYSILHKLNKAYSRRKIRKKKLILDS